MIPSKLLMKYPLWTAAVVVALVGLMEYSLWTAAFVIAMAYSMGHPLLTGTVVVAVAYLMKPASVVVAVVYLMEHPLWTAAVVVVAAYLTKPAEYTFIPAVHLKNKLSESRRNMSDLSRIDLEHSASQITHKIKKSFTDYGVYRVTNVKLEYQRIILIGAFQNWFQVSETTEAELYT